jgi:hypothetical protein
LALKYYWEIPRSGYILGTFRLNLDVTTFLGARLNNLFHVFNIEIIGTKTIIFIFIKLGIRKVDKSSSEVRVGAMSDASASARDKLLLQIIIKAALCNNLR